MKDLSGNGVVPFVGDRASQSEDSSTGQFYTVTLGSGAASWTNHCRALFIGTGGDLSAVNEKGDTVVFKNIPGGSRLDIRTKALSGVTAADIVRLM